MPWVRFEDTVHQNPKVMALSDRAFRLWFCTISWSTANLTDGQLPARTSPIWRLFGTFIQRPSVPAAVVAELVALGLWREMESGGYEINDFLKYQPSRAQVEAEREAARERMRRRRRDEDTGQFTENFDRSSPERSPEHAAKFGARSPTPQSRARASEASDAAQQAASEKQAAGGSGGIAAAQDEHADAALDLQPPDYDAETQLYAAAGRSLQALGVDVGKAGAAISRVGPQRVIAWCDEVKRRADVANPAGFVLTMLERGERPPARRGA